MEIDREIRDAPAMARGATLYRATLELSLIERGVYAEPTTSIAQHPSETLERTLVRLLAFALCFEEGLEFGRGISATDEPDLWSREGDGRPRLWLEVGQPEAKRLAKAARHAERVVLFASGDNLWRYRKAQFENFEAPNNLSVAAFDPVFIASLAGTIQRQIRWSVTLSEGILFLTSGNESFETTPEIWFGTPLG